MTCPDHRFCTVRHRFASPCELWDCNACWWHYKNCTKTEEPATDNCPYVTCQDLPRPSHNHTVATVSVISVAVFVACFFFFLRRRWRAWRSAGGEAEREPEADADVEEERLPLLHRWRGFFERGANRTSRVVERFRRLVWGGERADIAPPERLDVELGHHQMQGGEGQLADPFRPSAPPPAYEEVEREPNPIVRNARHSPCPTRSRSLVNQNYGSMRQRVQDSPREREVAQLEEIPLLHHSSSRTTTKTATCSHRVLTEARAVPLSPSHRSTPRLTHSQSLH